jgi:predicted nucleotidyltransferase
MPAPVSSTVLHLRRRAEEQAERGRRRRVELERWLPAAAEILRRHGATAVHLFGSVATGETSATSDLDLATEGLPGAAYFPALGELLQTLPCAVDLVRLEEAPGSLRDRVAAEGRRL